MSCLSVDPVPGDKRVPFVLAWMSPCLARGELLPAFGIYVVKREQAWGMCNIFSALSHVKTGLEHLAATVHFSERPISLVAGKYPKIQKHSLSLRLMPLPLPPLSGPDGAAMTRHSDSFILRVFRWTCFLPELKERSSQADGRRRKDGGFVSQNSTKTQNAGKIVQEDVS